MLVDAQGNGDTSVCELPCSVDLDDASINSPAFPDITTDAGFVRGISFCFDPKNNRCPVALQALTLHLNKRLKAIASLHELERTIRLLQAYQIKHTKRKRLILFCLGSARDS